MADKEPSCARHLNTCSDEQGPTPALEHSSPSVTEGQALTSRLVLSSKNHLTLQSSPLAREARQLLQNLFSKPAENPQLFTILLNLYKISVADLHFKI